MSDATSSGSEANIQTKVQGIKKVQTCSATHRTTKIVLQKLLNINRNESI